MGWDGWFHLGPKIFLFLFCQPQLMAFLLKLVSKCITRSLFCQASHDSVQSWGQGRWWQKETSPVFLLKEKPLLSTAFHPVLPTSSGPRPSHRKETRCWNWLGPVLISSLDSDTLLAILNQGRIGKWEVGKAAVRQKIKRICLRGEPA